MSDTQSAAELVKELREQAADEPVRHGWKLMIEAARAIETLADECKKMRICYHFVECKYCGPFHPDYNADCGNCDGFGRTPPECMQTDPEAHMRSAEAACAVTDSLNLLPKGSK